MTFLLLGFAAFGVSLLLAYAVGPSRRRVALVLAGGMALLFVWILAGFAFAGDDPCHDCGTYLGRSLDPVALWSGR